MIEIVICFALLGYGAIFFFSALGMQETGNKATAYRLRAESLARLALQKAQLLPAGQSRDETVKEPGWEFSVHYESLALAQFEASSTRTLSVRVQVFRPPQKQPVYQAARVLRVTEAAL